MKAGIERGGRHVEREGSWELMAVCLPHSQHIRTTTQLCQQTLPVLHLRRTCESGSVSMPLCGMLEVLNLSPRTRVSVPWKVVHACIPRTDGEQRQGSLGPAD